MKIVHNKYEEVTRSYKITSEQMYFPESSMITPEIGKLMEKLRLDTMRGKRGVTDQLQKSIATYPHVPQFRNYLYISYTMNGDLAEAKKTNDETLKKFPDYLFARIIRAHEYLDAGEPEKVAQLLGTSFNLSELYPDRKLFHITEEMSLQRLAVHYFTDIGDFEAASMRLDKMRQQNPDDPKLADAFTHWLDKYIDHLEVMPDAMTSRHKVRTNPVEKTGEMKPPRFKNKLVAELYGTDYSEFLALLPQFMKLPEKTLIADLELVLDDSIQRYHFFIMSEFSDSEMLEKFLDPNFCTDFLSHSIFLLGELGATQLLPKVLNVLAQSQAFINYYFSDVIAEYLWLAIYKLGASQPDKLKEFMLQPAVYTFSRSAIADVMAQVAHHHPERREEAVNWFKEVLEYYAKCEPADNVVDSLLIALMIAHLLDLRAKNLLPLIEILYKRGYVEEEMNGKLNMVRNQMEDPYLDDNYVKWELLPLEQHYEKLVNSIVPDPDFDEYSVEPSTFDPNRYIASDQPYVREKKVGRNDPCPCGSGLKYKKCCL